MSAPSSAPRLTPPEVPVELGDQWRALRRAATVVCLLATPAVFVWLYERDNVPLGWSIVLTIAAAGAFRGGLDLIFRRFIPWPTLFGDQGPAPRGRGRAQPPSRLVLALCVPLRVARRALRHGRLPRPAPARRGQHHVVGDGDVDRRRFRRGNQQPDVLDAGDLRLLPVHRQLPHLPGPDDADGHLADPRLRARRRDLGREARGRARPGRGQGGGQADRRPLAVGRAVREGGRQARAGPALPRRAGNREDDAREGDRDRVQLADRHDPRLGVRPDVHRHRRADRPLARP